jgi:DNA primase
MRDTIAEAKRRLPLPALMHRIGLGAHAKKRAFCPFHDDQRTSFSIYRDDKGEWRFKCFTGCGQGDEINFLELHEKLSRQDAIKRFLELAGVNGSTSAKRFVTVRAVEH